MDPDVVLCAFGHLMSELHVEGMDGDNFTHECNMCQQAIIQEKLPYSCDLCEYYLCIYCLSSIQSIQWTQHNDIKAQLISKAKPKKRKTKIQFDKFLTSNSPIILLTKMAKLDTKYWYKSTQFIVKIIEDAIFNKSIDATSFKQEKNIKLKKRNINYHKLKDKLYKHCSQHDLCCNQLLNILFLFGFRLQCNHTRLIWNKNIDQGIHPQICVLYCQLKKMVNENWKINDINDGDIVFNTELVTNPMRFIINRYCDIITNNENICADISMLIYEYAFSEYKVMKSSDTFPASFMRNLQFLQDPKQFNSLVMCVGNQRYLFINISPFQRSNGYIYNACNTYEGYDGNINFFSF